MQGDQRTHTRTSQRKLIKCNQIEMSEDVAEGDFIATLKARCRFGAQMFSPKVFFLFNLNIDPPPFFSQPKL